MSVQPTSELQPNLPELWMALQELEDGNLTPEQREELMSQLERSPAARRAYFEYFQQSAVFKMESAKMHELGLLPVVDLPSHSRRLFQRSILAAAAVIVLGGLLATLIDIKKPEPGMLNAAVAAATQWTVNGTRQNSDGSDLTVVEGSNVKVMSGTVELRLESGAVMVLRGPASASFPELQKPVLKRGWLWIDSGDSKERFEVTTPDLSIHNIGTRFGVRVPEAGPAEIHLIKGRVGFRRENVDSEVPTLVPVGKGTGIPEEGELAELVLAHDPFPGLPDLLAAEANYRTTLMSQAPVGYWKCDDLPGQKLADEISQSAEADYGLEVSLGAPGVGPKDRFNGFGEVSRSVQLLGDELKSLIIEIGGPDGVSRREGAVSFWIRRLPGNKNSEALWLAGETQSGSVEPNQSLIHTILTKSGRIQFFIENGKFDVELSSPRNLADGKWHHIVASWGPTAVELFVDGKRAAADRDSRILKDGSFGGRYVRFGKPSQDLRGQDIEPFTGWVDEIALWNRPLSLAEVEQQFRSALGDAAGRQVLDRTPAPND